MSSVVKGSGHQVWGLGLYVKVSQYRRKEQTTLSSPLVQWYEHIDNAHTETLNDLCNRNDYNLSLSFRLWIVTSGVTCNYGQCCTRHTAASDLQHYTMWCIWKIFAKLNHISNSSFHKTSPLCLIIIFIMSATLF